MPSIVDFISSIGASMLASSALIQVSRSQFRKSPGGPPALLIRMSGSGQAPRMASRPSLVVTSATTATISAPLCGLNFDRRALQEFATPCDDDEIDALGAQGSGAAPAQPHARRAHDRRAASNTEIHVFLAWSCRAGAAAQMRFPYLSFGRAMPAGFDPHMQKLAGSKPNCRGLWVASSSISVTPTEYSNTMSSGPLK
jgi:hypothetical protein